LCQWRKDPELCQKIGLSKVVFIEHIPSINENTDMPSSLMGRVMSDFPTLYEIVRGASKLGEVRRPGIVKIDIEHFEVGEASRLLGVRKVPRDRFEPARHRLRIVQHEVWIFGFPLISHPGNSI
jgi:hypothetical protein